MEQHFQTTKKANIRKIYHCTLFRKTKRHINLATGFKINQSKTFCSCSLLLAFTNEFKLGLAQIKKNTNILLLYCVQFAF